MTELVSIPERVQMEIERLSLAFPGESQEAISEYARSEVRTSVMLEALERIAALPDPIAARIAMGAIEDKR